MVRREDLIPGETKRIISWDDVKRDFSGRKIFFPIYIMRIRNVIRVCKKRILECAEGILFFSFFYSLNDTRNGASFSSFSYF